MRKVPTVIHLKKQDSFRLSLERLRLSQLVVG